MKAPGYQNINNIKLMQQNIGCNILAFSDILEDLTSSVTKVKKDEYSFIGEYSIIDQGKEFIAGYYNSNQGISSSGPHIVFGDHTRIFKYVDFPILLGADGTKLLAAKISDVNMKYLYYFFNTLSLPNDGYSRHFKYLKQVVIPLPNIQYQNKIANILDQAQRLIDKRKEQIALLDDLIQSLFYDMFGDPVLNKKGWKTRKLEEVANINMGQSPKGDSYNTDGVGIPLLNGPAEFGKRFPIEKQWTVSPTKKCVPNDILFCVRGATVGKMNFADKEYCIGRGLAAIQPNVGISHEFLYFILKMNTPVLIASSNGSTFMNVKKEQLSNILVFDTPQILQNEFMEKVNKIDQQKELLNKSLAELETNFNSLMQRAFRGELVAE